MLRQLAPFLYSSRFAGVGPFQRGLLNMLTSPPVRWSHLESCGVVRPREGPNGTLQGEEEMVRKRQVYASTGLTRKYRLLAATNFEFVAVRVFEKEGVVTRTVVLTNFWPLKVFPASVAHEFRNPIHFFARVRPKRDPRAVGTMVFVLIDTEKFHRPIGTPSIERMKIVARTFVNESKLRQKFSVELSRHFHAFHSQIDVIKATRFHFMILNRIA